MIPRSERRPAPHVLFFGAAALAALAALSIVAIDRPVARILAAYEPAAIWSEGMTLLEEIIGWSLHPLTVSFVIVGATLVVVCVPRLRWLAPAAMFLAGTHIFTRYAMGQLKDLTGRLRPMEWLARGGDETFFRGGASFPSGHVSLFAGIAIPIAILVPRARPVLAVAAFVTAARIAVNAHWLSDAIASIALVLLMAWLVGYAVRPLGSLGAPSRPQ